MTKITRKIDILYDGLFVLYGTIWALLCRK